MGNRPYFAAPHKVDEVVISYPPKPIARNGVHSQHREVHKQQLRQQQHVVIDNEKMNESLSISDENHMKVLEDDNGNEQLNRRTLTSMAAIADAKNSSLLDHVDLTTSQTLREDVASNGLDEEDVFGGNFANLSIDNGD